MNNNLHFFIAALFLSELASAAEFKTIEQSGIFEVESGEYESSQMVLIDSYGKNITVNVDTDGGGSVNITTGLSTTWALDSYGNYDSKSGGGSIIWNGGLYLNMRTAYNDFKPILANDGNSSIKLNGNLSVCAENSGANSRYSHNTFLIANEFYSKSEFNGDVDLSATTSNSAGDSIGAGVIVLRGEGVDMSLGDSSGDKIKIHGISTIANGGAESYGIYGYNYGGYNLNYVINVKGSALIEDINARSESSYSYAAGAEIHGGTLNFMGDLTIKDINAETTLALAAYNGGTINIKGDSDRTVKIESDIEVAGGGSSVNLYLSGSESYMVGGISEFEGGAATVSISEGAAWYINKNSSAASLEIDGGVLVLESGGRLEYGSKLSIGGESQLVFFPDNPGKTGNIALVGSAYVDASESAIIKVVLGDYYKDLTGECYLLLIDTTGIVESVDLDLENLSGIFVWEDGGESAVGWSLEFADGEGLYAVYNIPEPSVIAMFFSMAALLSVFLRRKHYAK